MSQYLPYKHFKRLDNSDDFIVTIVKEDSKFGYILEVDLELQLYNTIIIVIFHVQK